MGSTSRNISSLAFRLWRVFLFLATICFPAVLLCMIGFNPNTTDLIYNALTGVIDSFGSLIDVGINFFVGFWRILFELIDPLLRKMSLF